MAERQFGSTGFLVILGMIFVSGGGCWALGLGASIESACMVTGIGAGNCDFTNTGFTPGSACFRVSVNRNSGGEDVMSKVICSGRVGTSETKAVAFTMLRQPMTDCAPPTQDLGLGIAIPVGDWTSVCTVKVAVK